MFNKKLKGILLLFSCISLSNLFAQKGIVTSGGNAIGSSGTVSYTVGQIDFIAASNATGSISQGVQQPILPSLLPITLLDLNAKKQTDKVQINWETSTEVNSSKFFVQRSKNGNDFTTIKQVQAAGNSMFPLKYSTLDDNPVNGTNYYRISLIDKDGSSVFSKIVSVNFTNKGIVTIVYPNPTKNNFVLRVSDPSGTTTLQYSLFDVNGKLLLSNIITKTETTVQVNQLAAGTYFLKVLDKNQHEIKTFQINKSN